MSHHLQEKLILQHGKVHRLCILVALGSVSDYVTSHLSKFVTHLPSLSLSYHLGKMLITSSYCCPRGQHMKKCVDVPSEVLVT
jgi:hypothetical protein